MKVVVSVILLMICGGAVYGQSSGKVDAKLSGYMKGIEKARVDTSDKRDDRLGNANDEMTAYFEKINGEVLLKDEFGQAKADGLNYVTAEDKKLRMYDWDSETGGTMHFYNDIAVYKTGSGVKVMDMADTSVEGDPGGFYTSIDEVHTGSGKAVYLIHSTAIGSTKDRGESIDAYEIVGDKLVAKQFFLAKTKRLKAISYSYDIFAKRNEDKDLPSIHLSADKKTLYVPIVKEDGSFTKGNLVYVFDGEMFVYRK